jgi:PAS domain S-box-containing protein
MNKKIINSQEMINLVTLLNHIPSMVGVWDIDCNNVFANNAYSFFFNKTPEDLKGKNIRELLGENLYQLNLPYIQNVLQGIPQTFERKIPRAPGDSIHTLANYIPQYANNKVIGFYVIVTDISEIAQKNEQLKNLLNKKKAILRSAKFSIITCEVDGNISSFNEEAENILGYTAEEVVGKHSPALFHDINEIIAVAEELKCPVGFETFIYKAKNGDFDERQWTYIRKDQSTVQVKISVTALRDSENVIYGYMGMAKDLTPELLVKKELDLERSKSLHNARLAILGELASSIAHEINNPLTVIDGTVHMLDKLKDNPDKFSAKLETINKSVKRINKIVDGLKNFIHKREDVKHKIHSLPDVIKEVLILVEYKANKNAVPIILEFQDNYKILCNDAEIEQVLINLLNNAIDAIKNLDIKWIRIELSKVQSDIILKIIDSGLGIDPEIESKLFQSFFTTKPRGEGTGLGLSIVKEIIEKHNGSIAVDRKESHTCFKLVFPEVL